MEKASLKDTVRSQIGNFIGSIDFSCGSPALNHILIDGLIDTVDLLSDYYEEGTHLFPEILLVNDLKYLKQSIPCIFHIMYEGKLIKEEFGRAIKMCAPLTRTGWCIFFEVKEGNVKWGVANSGLTVTSLSLYDQVMSEESDLFRIAYIRNIGFKTVELLSAKGDTRFYISLSLNEFDDILRNEVLDLSKCIAEDCKEYSESFLKFLEKTINDTLQKGHGNLIVVVKDEKNIKIPGVLKEGVPMNENPLDLYRVFCGYKHDEKDLEAHSQLKMNLELVSSMMNHDGITAFTSAGRVIGYHFIVDNNMKATDVIVGGARTKAFKKLCMSEGIMAVLMKTQEGVVKYCKR